MLSLKPSEHVRAIFRRKWEFHYGARMTFQKDFEIDLRFQHLLNESMLEYLDEANVRKAQDESNA